jgi:outer membrane receptor protein involved in Fe transport
MGCHRKHRHTFGVKEVINNKIKMKYILITFLMLFVFNANYAQNNTVSDQKGVKINGKVVDEKDGNSLGFATVALLNEKDSKAVKGGQTDLDGKFTFENIEGGSYLLKISFVGYETFSKAITVKSNSPLLDLGLLKVKKSSGSVLNEVVVTARKDVIQLGIDRKVFNADQSLVSQGGSASDLLATVPSVQVDLDGNVSLRGTSNVRILIDGKPSTFGGSNVTQLLQSLPASSIDKVELITNPSSKYDPEGQSGIINIVLKKNQRLGVNGNVALTGSRYNGFNSNLGLNYRDEKWNLSGNYGYRTGDRLGSGITNTEFIGSTLTTPYSYAKESSISNDKSHTLKLGAEYYLTEQTSLALSGNYNTRNGNRDENLNQRFLGQNKNLVDYGTGFNLQDEKGDGYDLNLDFNHKFKRKDEGLTANFSYGKSGEDQNENIVQNFFDLNGTRSTSRISVDRANIVNEKNKNYNIQLDYTLPLSTDSKLETGYRTTLKYNNEDQISDTLNYSSEVYFRDRKLTSLFKLEDFVHAIYTSYQNQFTKNFGIQFGLRAEQAYLNTSITGSDANGNSLNTLGKLDYLRVYPSLFFTQKFKTNNQLQLSYTRRVNRPRGWQVNPFPDVDDRYNIRIGNPNLKPEDIHSFEFSYAKFWNFTTLTSSVYFRQVNDVVQSLRTANPDQIGGTISRFYNLSKNQAYGLELIGRTDISKKLNVTGNLNFFQSVFKGNSSLGINDNSGFNWNGNLTANATLQKDLSAQASFFYSAPRTISQGKIQQISTLDAGLKYDILNKKGSLSFNVRDIFNTRRFNMLTDNGFFNQELERRRKGGVYSLTFSYRFGKQDFSAKRNQKKDGMQQPDEENGF